jgi:hypothetical protein
MAVRQQWLMSKDIFARRSELIKRIPLFWTKVMQGSPTTLEQYFNMTDSTIIEQHLTDLEVSRFELEADPKNGDPRSFSVKFTFSDNEYFEDKELAKKFWFRYSSDGWTGYVSEPVKIHWKDGKDTTDGMLDAAIALWEARQKAEAKDSSVKQETLPEYQKIVEIRDKTDNDSFFRFFGFVSGKRFVSAEESTKAQREEKERREKAKKGESVEDPPEEDLEDYDQDAEIMAEADDIASTLAEDIYPSAIKYFSKSTSTPAVLSLLTGCSCRPGVR